MSPAADRSPLALSSTLQIDPPIFLAPMEGITDRSFRSLVLEGGGAIGAACTEFLRVTEPPLPVKRIAQELGPPQARPVAVQLMGNKPDMVAATAARAAEAGAAWVDLNFGCPAPRVFQHCAGSALLDDPPALERLVAETVRACPLPVTAKIRAGVNDDARLEEIAQRAEQAGAAALTVHARLRVERYSDPADWSRIRRAVAATTLPVVGNGSASDVASIDAMFAETGCAGVMVGRGALRNPWLFQDYAAHCGGFQAPVRDADDVFTWMHAYADRMAAGGATDLQVTGRLKQACKYMAGAGTLALDGPALRIVLRSNGHAELFEHLRNLVRTDRSTCRMDLP